MAAAPEERTHREQLWRDLIERGGPRDVEPGLLRELGVYGGAQGIWVDKQRTKQIDEAPLGATVAVLHTGTSYDDDFSEEGVIYHYPQTARGAGRDAAEIDATKAAARLVLPIFVVRYTGPGRSLRSVYRGWVEDWDDESHLFLISFSDTAPVTTPADADEPPFQMADKSAGTKREISARLGQQRFKFRVLKRYGPRCALCGLDVAELLDAAHLCSKKDCGSDDPRNGLVLCALHHRAFDAGFFAVEPTSLELQYRPEGPDRQRLCVTVDGLRHLPRHPHREPLEWLWARWKTANQRS